jgi:hypothetical protein
LDAACGYGPGGVNLLAGRSRRAAIQLALVQRGRKIRHDLAIAGQAEVRILFRDPRLLGRDRNQDEVEPAGEVVDRRLVLRGIGAVPMPPVLDRLRAGRVERHGGPLRVGDRSGRKIILQHDDEAGLVGG